MRRVVVLCGPPGAGKTTAARASGLPVFDRDDPGWESEAAFCRALEPLARDPRASAVVIRSGASSSARSKAVGLVAATHVFLLMPDASTCAARVRQRDRRDRHTGLAAIGSWFERFDHRDGVPLFPGWDPVFGRVAPSTSREW